MQKYFVELHGNEVKRIYEMLGNFLFTLELTILFDRFDFASPSALRQSSSSMTMSKKFSQFSLEHSNPMTLRRIANLTIDNFALNWGKYLGGNLYCKPINSNCGCCFKDKKVTKFEAPQRLFLLVTFSSFYFATF